MNICSTISKYTKENNQLGAKIKIKMKIGLHMRVGPADRGDAERIGADAAGDAAFRSSVAGAYGAEECRRTPHLRTTECEMSEDINTSISITNTLNVHSLIINMSLIESGDAKV